MLFILTAPQQTGKTCWLEALIAELDGYHIPTYGVIAPGRWKYIGEKRVKLGIDNILLPTHEHFSLATKAAGTSGTSGLGWTFSDTALSQVNAHFHELSHAADIGCFKDYAAAANYRKDSVGSASCRNSHAGGILIVDELGPLELLHGSGLTEALSVLQQGPRQEPQPLWSHAVVVVRPSLVSAVKELLRGSWGTSELIQPTDSSKALLLETLLA